MSHTEIPVHVNAWVDQGVAPLVNALNRFPRVITIDSCEGEPNSPAYVHFGCRGDASELSSFVGRLSSEVGRLVKADSEYSLRIEWMAGADEPLATLYARRDYVEPLARAIEELAMNKAKEQKMKSKRQIAEMYAKVHHAHMHENSTVRGVAQSMVKIMYDKSTASDEYQAALGTLTEALFPSEGHFDVE